MKSFSLCSFIQDCTDYCYGFSCLPIELFFFFLFSFFLSKQIRLARFSGYLSGISDGLGRVCKVYHPAFALAIDYGIEKASKVRGSWDKSNVGAFKVSINKKTVVRSYKTNGAEGGENSNPTMRKRSIAGRSNKHV